jgi:hypothetical protein
MQITRPQIDDFKTDRKDIMPPLQGILRLVPLLFYCSIGVTIILGSIFLVQARIAAAKKAAHVAQTALLNSQARETRDEKAALETQIKKAQNVQRWVEGSHPVQPMVIEITKSMGPQSSIVDFQLARIPDNSAQFKLSLDLITPSAKQIDPMLEQLSKLNYRAVSPQQEIGKGQLQYRATLVQQETAAP